MIFVDSNIPMYVAGGEHPNKAPAERLLGRVRDGEVEACTSTEVLQEILYRYAALERRDLGIAVYDAFVEICPIVLPVALADTDLARNLVNDYADCGVRDAVHAAVMINHEVETVASFDTGFDEIPGVTRLEMG